MWDPGRGRLRLARAGAVGLVVAGVASASHVAGGGAHTSWLAVALACVAVTVVAAVIGSRRIGTPTLLVLLVAAQVGVHALTGYLHGLTPWHDPSMLLAHVVGVAASAVVLARGEALVWRLHAWLRPSLVGRPPAAPVVARPVPTATVALRNLAPLLAGSLSRRGPPVSVV